MGEHISAILISALFLLMSMNGIISVIDSDSQALDDDIVRYDAVSVSSTISFNTTWTSSNSPYYLNSPIIIQQGVRLTI